MLRRLAASTVIACSLFVLTASQTDLQARQSGSAAGAAMTTLRVGYIPIVDLLPMYVAINQGYFAQENIKLHLVAMSGGATIIPAMQGGSLDLGFSNVLSVLIAANHGLKPVLITGGNYDPRAHPTQAILVMNNSAIHSATDLEGKTVAVNTLNNIAHVIAEQWMKDHGANPARARFTELDFPQMLAPLTHKQIDAAYEVEPFITILKSMGARVLVYPMAAENPLTYIASPIALRPYATAHRDLITRFVRAYNRGIDFVATHNHRARLILSKFTQVTPALALKINLPVWKKHTPLTTIQYWSRLGHGWHLLNGAMNVNQVLWPTAR
jgi:NitT/TauT family transport system substrate-binding protein